MGLRDKYKSASLEDLKKKADEENAILGHSSFGDYLPIEDGKTNKFRIFPPHSGADFFLMKRQCWITINTDDGETGRRTVLNSRLHGDTKLDIIEEYIKFATSNVKDKEKLKTLSDWKTGISFDTEWVAYASKIIKDKTEFGLLAFKKTVRDELNKNMFMEDDDDPIEVDPFTDVEEGLPVLIKYNSKPNKKKGEDYYVLNVAKKPVALTDEDLEKFDKCKTLHELFRGVYTLKDFELALQGAEFYDIDNELDLFEDDRWLEIVEKVKSQYDDIDEDEDGDEEEEEEKPKKKKPAKKKVEEEIEEDEEDEEEDEEDEGDKFDVMDRLTLRKLIKKEGMEIKVKKSMSDDDIRDLIRNYSEEEEVEEEEEKSAKKAPKKKMTVEEIRAKLKGK